MRLGSLYKLIAFQAILSSAFFFMTAKVSVAEVRGDFTSEGPASCGELSSSAYCATMRSKMSAAQFASLRCTPVKVTSGWMGAHTVTYYQCGNNWYIRAYSGSNITYVLVKPPANPAF